MALGSSSGGLPLVRHAAGTELSILIVDDHFLVREGLKHGTWPKVHRDIVLARREMPKKPWLKSRRNPGGW